MFGRFKNKTAFQAYVRSILKTGLPLTDEAYTHIAALLPTIPDYEPSWTLCRHLKWDGRYHSLCVFANNKYWRTSYMAFGQSKDAYDKKHRRSAQREAVRDSKEALRTAPLKAMEIDHTNPGGFEAIAKGFDNENTNLSIEQTSQGGHRYMREKDAVSFLEQHNTHATLEEVTRDEHVKRTAKRQRRGVSQ